MGRAPNAAEMSDSTSSSMTTFSTIHTTGMPWLCRIVVSLILGTSQKSELLLSWRFGRFAPLFRDRPLQGKPASMMMREAPFCFASSTKAEIVGESI